MHINIKRAVRWLASLVLLPMVGGVQSQEATPEMTPEMEMTAMMGMPPEGVVAMYEGLFPEGVEYDPVNERFLVSSVSEGTVFAVADDGTVTPFIEDERIPSSIGLEVDEANNRLLVAATDQETQAFLGIYELTTGENLAFIDLGALTPNDVENFANDIAVDAAGNAYVTDSLAGVIYRVDLAGNAEVFLEDDTFSTQFALNGIDYHAEGNYLIAVVVPRLIKIPLDNPAAFTPVEFEPPIPGEDGILLVDERSLAVVSNVQGRVYLLESDDDFATATSNFTFETGNVNPTTLAMRDGEIYVLYAQLNANEPVTDYPIQRVPFND